MKTSKNIFRNWATGFSLVELMTVVVIVSILAAIALPQYMKYVKKSRTTEAVSNLGAIAMFEETYFSEGDTYVTAAPNPAGAPPSPADGGGRKTFDSALTGWPLLGRVIPHGTPLYFQYEIRAGRYNSTSPATDSTAVIGGTGGLVAPNTTVAPGGSSCTGSAPASFSANSLSIPKTPSSNWFYATATGNQDADAICSFFIKVIDRPDIYIQDEIE